MGLSGGQALLPSGRQLRYGRARTEGIFLGHKLLSEVQDLPVLVGLRVVLTAWRGFVRADGVSALLGGQAFLRELVRLSVSLSLQSKDYEVVRLGAQFLSQHFVGLCHIRLEPLGTLSVEHSSLISSDWLGLRSVM
jgi:hypothetical protein